MSWNDFVVKNILDLNDAGDSQYNPILSGLPIQFVIEFSQTVYSFTAYIGSSSPPTTEITFTQDITNSRKYIYTGIAGSGDLSLVDQFTNLRIVFKSNITGDESIIDKKFYIASLPIDSIQVYDQIDGWTNVNFATIPTNIPDCAQMCGIRFFNSWYDDFRINTYGGAKYVSVYDYGTSENDTDRLQVKRETNIHISKLRYIYLAKHNLGQVENHDITVKLKTDKYDSNGLELRIKVNSLSCWGFEIKDPVTE